MFRKYDEDGSQSIDISELKNLLKDLNVPFEDEGELDKLWKELDPEGAGHVKFEAFFQWFDREASKKKRNILSSVVSSGLNAVKSTFKRMLIEIGARNTIIDHVVYRTLLHAYTEYRMAHPPLYPCTKQHCYECFPNASKLHHVSDKNIFRINIVYFFMPAN